MEARRGTGRGQAGGGGREGCKEGGEKEKVPRPTEKRRQTFYSSTRSYFQ